MGKLSRTKGHAFERKIAAALRKFFPNARRELEYQIGGLGIDLAETGPFKIQCKKRKTYASVATIGEVKCDRMLGDIPVLVTAGDNEPAMVVLHFEDWLAMLYHFPK